jgi:hypothetical protein
MSLQYRNKSKSQLTSPTPPQLSAVALSSGHIVCVQVMFFFCIVKRESNDGLSRNVGLSFLFPGRRLQYHSLQKPKKDPLTKQQIEWNVRQVSEIVVVSPCQGDHFQEVPTTCS